MYGVFVLTVVGLFWNVMCWHLICARHATREHRPGDVSRGYFRCCWDIRLNVLALTLVGRLWQLEAGSEVHLLAVAALSTPSMDNLEMRSLRCNAVTTLQWRRSAVTLQCFGKHTNSLLHRPVSCTRRSVLVVWSRCRRCPAIVGVCVSAGVGALVLVLVLLSDCSCGCSY